MALVRSAIQTKRVTELETIRRTDPAIADAVEVRLHDGGYVCARDGEDLVLIGWRAGDRGR